MSRSTTQQSMLHRLCSEAAYSRAPHCLKTTVTDLDRVRLFDSGLPTVVALVWESIVTVWLFVVTIYVLKITKTS